MNQYNLKGVIVLKKKDNEKEIKTAHDSNHHGDAENDAINKEEESTEPQISNEETDEDIKGSDAEKDSQMEGEIEKLQIEAQKMKDMALRTQADFVNYKKRIAKEKIDIVAFANEQLILEQLQVIDNFERALESEKNKDDGFYKGVELILKQLMDTLTKFGLKEIEAMDKPFDHNFHHAVMQEEGDNPEHVCAVLQKGYMLKDKVIRPAMVKVTK